MILLKIWSLMSIWWQIWFVGVICGIVSGLANFFFQDKSEPEKKEPLLKIMLASTYVTIVVAGLLSFYKPAAEWPIPGLIALFGLAGLGGLKLLLKLKDLVIESLLKRAEDVIDSMVDEKVKAYATRQQKSVERKIDKKVEEVVVAAIQSKEGTSSQESQEVK